MVWFFQDITGDAGVGLLVNNAANHPMFNKITSVKVEQMMDTFNVNVVGPLLLTKSLLPLLKTSSKKTKASNAEAPLILNMSTALGSIGKNKGSGE